jgi:hypothetical protein
MLCVARLSSATPFPSSNKDSRQSATKKKCDINQEEENQNTEETTTTTKTKERSGEGA